MAKRKKKNDPLFPVRPRAARNLKPHQHSRWPIIQAALDRTRAGRAELDELANGADLSSVADLPAVVLGARRRVEPTWRDSVVSPKQGRERPADRTLPKHAKKPRKPKRCKLCRLEEHPGAGCNDMAEWLKLAAAVLSGELDVSSAA